MKRSLFIAILSLFLCHGLYAQSVLWGQVFDKSTGDPLIGAQVVLDGGKGSVTDLDGMFHIQLESVKSEPYTVEVRYVGYQTKRIPNYDIPDFAIQELNVALEPRSESMEEVVIEEEVLNENEFAMLRLQKNSLAVQDGISNKQIERLGATNAAQSMKQVVGASVEEDKFVVMRGLGDRYSTTQLNGMRMMSTDPYRNSSAMDVIPTSMIENIITTKTFTPDQPGNFTGGNVNITTRSIPVGFFTKASFSYGLVRYASFNNNFIADPAGDGLDGFFLPNDNRELPETWENVATNDQYKYFQSTSTIQSKLRLDNDREFIDQVASTGDNKFIPETFTPGGNWAFSSSAGDRKNVSENFVIGYNGGITLRNSYKNFQDYELGAYEFSPGAGSLNPKFQFKGENMQNTRRASGFGSLAAKVYKNTELEFKAIINNTAEENAMDLRGVWPQSIGGDHQFVTRSLQFLDRQQQTLQLSADHSFINPLGLNFISSGKAKFILDLTQSTLNQPDTRLSAYKIQNGIEAIDRAEFQFPYHFYRNLRDSALNAKVDIDLNLGDQNKGNKIKFGGLVHYKQRDFYEYRFQYFSPNNVQSEQYSTLNELDGAIDRFVADNNTGILGQDSAGDPILGNLIFDQSQSSNFYNGTEAWYAAYAMGVYKIGNLKLVGGARGVLTDMSIENQNDEQGEFTTFDILPSLNAIYALNEDQNLRFAASQTLARPNLREMAPIRTFDLIGGFFYQGSSDISRTLISNLDLRYEWYTNPGEIIAVSGFSKFFEDPIVQVFQNQAQGSTNEIRPVNVSDAFLVGVELEYRKYFYNIESLKDVPFIKNLGINTNLSLIYSEVQKSDREINSNNALGSDLPETRPFQAQSPYLFNMALTYRNDSINFESTVSANFYGPRVSENGNVGIPDAYEQLSWAGAPDGPPEVLGVPVVAPTLNWTAQYSVTEWFDIVLRMRNLVNPWYVKNSEFRNEQSIVERYRTGENISLKLKAEF